VSPRGIKAWLVEEHSIPLVAIRFAFMGGAAQDPPGKEGLADMVSDLLTEGAGDMSAKTFKEKVSQLGTRLSVSSARDAIYGGMRPCRSGLRRLPNCSGWCCSVLVSMQMVERARAQHLTDLRVPPMSLRSGSRSLVRGSVSGPPLWQVGGWNARDDRADHRR
jgi:hypothetical protein